MGWPVSVRPPIQTVSEDCGAEIECVHICRHGRRCSQTQAIRWAWEQTSRALMGYGSLYMSQSTAQNATSSRAETMEGIYCRIFVNLLCIYNLRTPVFMLLSWGILWFWLSAETCFIDYRVCWNQEDAMKMILQPLGDIALNCDTSLWWQAMATVHHLKVSVHACT